MASKPSQRQVIKFGVFEVDVAAAEVRKAGMRQKLTGQPFQVLQALLERPQEIVTREELRERLWPGNIFVDSDLALKKAVNRLREVLGDSAENPRYVETVPRKGYRFIGAITSGPSTGADSGELRSSGAVETASMRARSRSLPVWKRRLLTTALASLCVLVAGATFWVFRQRGAASDSSSHLKVFPLTGSLVGETDPAFSPDGTQLAYVGQDEKQRNFNVYVKLIGAGQPLRLTSNAEDERFPAWSPDGRYIAFLRNTQQGNDVYVIPALGGSERKLTQAAWYDSSLSWSPDGKLLAIADQTSSKEPVSIFLVSVEDGSKRKVTSPPAESAGDICPAFSPDGRTLAFNRLRGASGALFALDGDVYVQDIVGDATAKAVPRRLTFDNVQVAGLDWAADGRSIVFSSNRSGSLRLWRMGLQGSPSQLVAPGDNAVFPSISRKRGWLAYRHDPVVKEGLPLRTSGFIYQLKLSSPAKDVSPARFCPSSQGDISPQFSPDGARVVFSSRRSGDGELWLCKNDGSGATQFTSSGGFSGSPQWSPDGQKVAFDYLQGGRFDIRVASVEQGLPRRLTSGNSNSVRPSWSNDGKWIYFSSDATGIWQVWKIPSQGGPPLQVTRHGGFEARESPDGKFAYYTNDFLGAPGIWKIPLSGGQETRLINQGTSGLWAVVSRGIYFVVPSSTGGPAVEFFNFTTQRTAQIASLPQDTHLDTIDPAFAVSPDERTILYGQAIPPGNIIVVENFH